MHEVDEPIEGDDTAGDVLLVRGDEAMDEAVERVQREVRARSDATGVRIWGGGRLVKEVTFGSDPDETPPDETAESIPDRAQRQVSEALVALDAVANQIAAVGLSLVEAGVCLGDDDHDLMLHEATELAGTRRQVRKVQRSIGERRDYLDVRSG